MPRSQFKDVLYETFEETRKDISKAILKQSSLPPTYPSLGPVMFFLADSTTGCIHNWSGTTWNELKLGWMLREIFSPIYDIISETRDEILELILKNSDKEKANSVFGLEKGNDQIKSKVFFKNFYDSKNNKISITTIKSRLSLSIADDEISDLIDTLNIIYELQPKLKIIKRNYARKFDRFWDEDEIKKICHFINQMKEHLEISLFPQLGYVVNKYLKNSGIQFPLTRIDEKRTLDLILKLIEITNGRLDAFREFEDLINAQDGSDFSICQKENCNNCSAMPQLCRYIFEHPRVKRDKGIRADVQRDWNRYLQSVLKSESSAKLIEEKTNFLVELFAYFPQEIRSSHIFDQLQRRLKKELSLRKDFEIITLNDLSLLKKLSYNNQETSEYKLYNYTHTLERLYYGGSVTKERNGGAQKEKKVVQIDNAFIVPIRIFDAQIKGQLVILSPDKISKTDCFNAINKHYTEIREAAKLDFYASILEDISDNSNEETSFASALSSNLPKILMLEGLLTWEGENFINMAIKEEDKAISFGDQRQSQDNYLHLKLKYKKYGEIQSEDHKRSINSIYKLILEDNESWDYESTEIQYYSKECKAKDDSPFNIFLNNDQINSRLVIKFSPKFDQTLKSVVLILFFNESVDQMNISIERIVDTIYYSFIFQHTAKLFSSHKTRMTWYKHDHQSDDASNAIEKLLFNIKQIQKFGYDVNVDKLKYLINYEIEPSVHVFRNYWITRKTIAKYFEDSYKNNLSGLNSFDILEALNKTQSQFKGDLNNNSIELSIISPRGFNKIFVKGQEGLCIEILTNLLRNSLEAFEKLNSNKRKSITVIFQYESDSRLVMVYEDNAGGIPEDIFIAQSIWSEKTTTLNTGVKKGFGLAQVKEFSFELGWGKKFVNNYPYGIKIIFNNIFIAKEDISL